MAKMIVLVRHGKAQLRSDELPDFERELTEAGVRALKAWLPRAARLLAEEHPKSIELWTSPAVRAWQTADLVADEFVETLGIKELETIEMPCLWTQDLSEFFAAAAECESDVVVAVGHNPFMEEATAHCPSARQCLKPILETALRLRLSRNCSWNEVMRKERLMSFAKPTSRRNYPMRRLFLRRERSGFLDALQRRRLAGIATLNRGKAPKGSGFED